MSLSSRIEDLSARIGTAVKQLNTALSGKANSSHVHSAADITSGVLNSSRLPDPSTTTRGALVSATDEQVQNGSTGTNLYVSPKQLAGWEAWIRPPRKNLVVVGSSNALPTTWVSSFTSIMGWTAVNGWTVTNAAIGGASYTGAGSFYEQLATARTTIGAANAGDVGCVIIADCSNNTRAKTDETSFTLGVRNTLARARSYFPNARIVILPLIWPSDSRKYWPKTTLGYDYPAPLGPSIYMNLAVMRNLSLEYRCEFVENSWTWLTGNNSFMNAVEDVHPGTSGYTQIARYLAKYFQGESTLRRSSWRPASIIDSGYFYFQPETSYQKLGGYIEGWTAYVNGVVASVGATNNLSDFAKFDPWFCPEANVYMHGFAVYSGVPVGVTLWPNGTMRCDTAIGGASNLMVNATYTLY